MVTFKIAAIFKDNMVLQRNKKISIWGTGTSNSKITARINDNLSTTKVDKDGNWILHLNKMSEGGPYILSITDETTDINLSNVMIGEVWFAGGQSNMDMELINSLNGKEELKNINPNIRYYYTPKITYFENDYENIENQSIWEDSTSEYTWRWSAVAYYFAKKLAEKLNITIAIIGCTYGGTSASVWVDNKTLNNSKLKYYLEDYNNILNSKTEDEYLNELNLHNERKMNWDKKCNELKFKNPLISYNEIVSIIGDEPWCPPMGFKSPFRPCGLYETMLKRVCPYTIQGFIYYQGEGDDQNPHLYQELLTSLIKSWRKEWKDDNLSFIFVQLPMYMEENQQDFKHWCLIREAQLKTYLKEYNVGIANAIDLGELNNIHPVNKKPVGERLASQALYLAYKYDIDENGPMYRSHKIHNNYIEITFNYAENGFLIKGEFIKGFEIAGQDKIFFPAQAIAKGDKIRLSSKDVENPKYARYLWYNYYPEITLYNNIGLPAFPFRTYSD